RVRLDMLAVIDRQPPVETATALLPALQEGVLLPLEDSEPALSLKASSETAGRQETTVSYRFLHDRVQQSAYSMIPDAERPALHLRIGRLLWQSATPAALEATLFDIVSHFAAGIDRIEERAERIAIAELMLRAGKKARAALAYETAARFLRLGIKLLP